jgi:hypothetical protein
MFKKLFGKKSLKSRDTPYTENKFSGKILENSEYLYLNHKTMKKIVRLTERDLTRLVKQIIKESNGDELEDLKNDIDDICEEYQDEVKQMVKRNGSLNLDEAKEILSDLKNNLEEFLEESSHDEMSDEDYFDLEEYAGDCVSNFISFLNEHTD